MFDTLDEQIERTEGIHLTSKQKLLRYAGLFIVTVLVFGALYLAVRSLG
jgi:hypothetical protein